MASFRKIQGLPISKIVRTADSTIIIITNFFLAGLPRNFLKGRRKREHEGAWDTPKAPAAAPPYKNPGSATERPARALRAGEVISYTVSQKKNKTLYSCK